MSWIEIAGLIAGVAYTLFEILQMRVMWIIGIFSAAAYIIIFYADGLYAAMGLQAYFLVMSIYGIRQWTIMKRAVKPATAVQPDMQENTADTAAEKNAVGEEKIYYKIPTAESLMWSIIALTAATAAMYFIIKIFSTVFSSTPDPYPFWDALSTGLSIIGTYWLSKSYLPQWFLWIAADIILIVLFVLQGGMASSVILYSIYTLAEFYGIYHWKKSGVKI